MNRLFRRILLFCLMATLVLLPASAETFAGVDGALADAQAVILFTTDVHCGVSDGVGYAGVAGVRAALEEAGKDVLLVDVGDAIQGAPLGSLSEGEYVTRIMNELGYDAAVPGNHEFDYGMERFLELAENASFPYVAANFMSLETGESVFPAYVMLEAGGYQFAILGICTPKTITSSTPVYFQNDAGEFIYGFCQDDSGEALYACVQAAADEARAQGADYVVAAAHLGIDISCSPWTSSELIENTTGIDAVLDGHAHQVIEGEWVKNKDGEDVLLTSTGTKLERLGALCVGGDGALSAVSIAAVDEGMIDADMVEFIAGIEGELAEVTETVVATSEVDLVIEDPETGERIVRTAETNLGDLCADAYRAVTGADVAMVNGGGVRASIAAGEITYGDIISVHPFGNEVCMVETTGAQILDALEMGCSALPGEFGGFQQVSGLTYEIDMNVDSSVELDENGMFVGVTGERRVKNVYVGDEPLDPEKTYTLASHNYMLKNGGDGFNMFVNDELILEDIMLDNEALTTYIVDTLGGVIGEEYADPYGQGRITAIAKE
ncbi:MAG TPA: bifunctional metallophosphatase/5'-nucleotidase [Candidatus Pullichristensenella stercorigallinarum]|uniref:Bifunctional metallophosphatase/5'-nucleotidase n=1 Tax=Candidatus Pullichristensenella stercorigallinarum TaxID=2840909 RepID=A0A9D1CX88_9FIRM|nr:bifunctional metallophosphatase/5'-nucleotidase [Candidatus Pullichristensenella stercorigallinarum]